MSTCYRLAAYNIIIILVISLLTFDSQHLLSSFHHLNPLFHRFMNNLRDRPRIYVDSSVHRELKILAAQEGIPVNRFADQILLLGLQTFKQTQKPQNPLPDTLTA